MNIDIKKISKILSDLRESKDIETYIELFQKNSVQKLNILIIKKINYLMI